MTRDEAIEIVERALLKINGIPNAGRDYAHIRRQAEIDVECNVALGMLRLDEPKTKMEKIGDLMEHFGVTCYSPIEFENWARVVGLEIVEK